MIYYTEDGVGTKCPRCGGPADNGFDRSWPEPKPDYCTKCVEVLEMSYSEKLRQHTRLTISIENRIIEILKLCGDLYYVFPNIDMFDDTYGGYYIENWVNIGSYIRVDCKYVDQYDSTLDCSDSYNIPTEWLDMDNEEIVECAKKTDNEAREKELRGDIRSLEREADRLGYKLVKK